MQTGSMFPFYVNAIMILIIDCVILKLTRDKIKRRKYICIANTIQIFLFFALRGMYVGNDTDNYVNYFNMAVANPNLALEYDYFEYGFRAFVCLIVKFTNNPQIFLAITGLITILPYSILVYKYSNDCILSFFAYSTMEFILFAMSGMRQNVATCFVSISFILFFQNNKKSKVLSLFFLLIASTFHYSALAFLLLYIISFFDLHKYKLFYIITLIFVFIFKGQISNILVTYFYSDYNSIGSSGAYMRVFVPLFIFLICYKYSDRLVLKNKNNVIFINCMFITVIFFILALDKSTYARLGRYFFIFFTLLLPELKYIFKKEDRKIINIAFVIILLGLMFYLFPNNGLCNNGYYFW